VSQAQLAVEHFPALSALPEVVHGFTLRVPGIEMSHDKAEALARLDTIHRKIRAENQFGSAPFITAQQIHGKEIAVVNVTISTDKCFANCDGIIADQPGICLGIYVADCCAVYLVDPVRRAIGLVHSGKKGTELGVVPNAIKMMAAQFGSRAGDLVVQLSPCIRPPHYEIDFAADIVRQCRDLGVSSIHDSGVCTACDLPRYYSYRAEKSRTGRMLAFLGLRENSKSEARNPKQIPKPN
jgi:copper oxidase (laccase) domain-containing protein